MKWWIIYFSHIPPKRVQEYTLHHAKQKAKFLYPGTYVIDAHEDWDSNKRR